MSVTASEAIRLGPRGRVPNSVMPVLVHRAALAADAGAGDYERRFARNGWSNAWRNGVYPFHHFHSTAHEVLGIAGGSAVLRLGGETGPDVAVSAGDVVVLPAGTGHKRIEADPGFLVVGAYPDGRDWDLLRADTVSDEDLRHAATTIAALPIPERDPATGEPLAAVWHG